MPGASGQGFSLHRGSRLGNSAAWEEERARNFRARLQIDSVCMNKHQLRKTSSICMRGAERGPFGLFRRRQQRDISLTSERAASYYHHYRHQHNTGCGRIALLGRTSTSAD